MYRSGLSRYGGMRSGMGGRFGGGGMRGGLRGGRRLGSRRGMRGGLRGGRCPRAGSCRPRQIGSRMSRPSRRRSTKLNRRGW